MRRYFREALAAASLPTVWQPAIAEQQRSVTPVMLIRNGPYFYHGRCYPRRTSVRATGAAAVITRATGSIIASSRIRPGGALPAALLVGNSTTTRWPQSEPASEPANDVTASGVRRESHERDWILTSRCRPKSMRSGFHRLRGSCDACREHMLHPTCGPRNSALHASVHCEPDRLRRPDLGNVQTWPEAHSLRCPRSCTSERRNKVRDRIPDLA